MTRTALLRGAVAPLFATALGVTALGATALTAPPAQAAPPVTDTAPADDDSADANRPVQIDVGRFEPRTVTPGALVTVTGTLTNTGPDPITDLNLRLQRGDLLTTRSELAAASDGQDPATTVVAPFERLSGDLAPGDELDFSYTVAAEELRLARDGVYPVLFNVNGTVEDGVGGGEQRRVGELSSYLVQQPVVPTARTAVAWLWPLIEPSHRTAAGGFRDDGLTDSVDTGGRLDRALAVVERLPGTLAPGATEPVPAVQVTLAIDPALVEELRIMADGPYEVNGEPGRGTEAAAAYLERLAAVAAVHPVVALPYGDVDADALVSAGVPDVVTRSLPGTPDGTAQAAPPRVDPAEGTAGTPPPDEAAEQPEPADSDIGAGAAILADALDVEPRTDLAWSVGGSLRADTLTTLQAGGVEQVVVGPAGLTDGEAAVGFEGATAAARTAIPTAAGPLGALVADPTLSALAGSAERAPGGARLAEQRYLAELAVLTMQAPDATEQTVLVAAPRDVEAGLEGAGAMMADTTGLPWLRPATVGELAAAPPVPAGELADPVDAPGLDPAGMAEVVAGVALREDLAGAVAGDPDIALRSYDAAIARSVSAGRRTDPDGFRDVATALRTTLERVRGEVTLLAPADGTYTLGSSDAPLVLTVQNNLPFPVRVLLEIRTRGIRGLSIGDIGPQTLAPGQRSTLQVPTEVRQAGGFAVTAQLTSPGGGALGDQIQLQVRSTAYGPISLIITIGAAALLGLLFLRRLVHFVLRRRRATAGDTEASGGIAAGGTELQQPPNRSPV
jgi:hypothetical protein